MTQTDGLLFDPNTYDPQQFDAETRRLLRATIGFFEGQGKKRLLDDDLAAAWPAEFVEFVKREKLFATFLTPSEFADGGSPDKRWDGARNAALSEILGFYGLTYWYTEQSPSWGWALSGRARTRRQIRPPTTSKPAR
jgi:acyl-CoA dehydrogenase